MRNRIRVALLAFAVAAPADALVAQELVVDLDPRPSGGAAASSRPIGFVRVGAQTFFTAQRIERDLWVTDGTAAGTRRVFEAAAFGLKSISSLTEHQGKVYFAGSSRTDAAELWVSDGSATGTQRLSGVGAGMAWSSVTQLTSTSSGLFFEAGNPARGSELWVSSGTRASTRPVVDLRPGAQGSNPKELTPFGAGLVFEADDGQFGRELWRSDGTAAGTVRISDIATGVGDSAPADLAVSGGQIFFRATGFGGDELWVSTGSLAGTRRVADIRPGSQGSSPRDLTVAGDGTVYFFADDGVRGIELWRTDGSAANTRIVRDLNPAVQGAAPYGLTAFGNSVLFSMWTFAEGHEPYISDGTSAGTRALGPVFPGRQGSDIRSYSVSGRRAVFTAFTPRFGAVLWATDGTPAGTRMLTDARGQPAFARSLLSAGPSDWLFAIEDARAGTELGRTTGQAGTISLLADIAVANRSGSPSAFQSLGGWTYFQTQFSSRLYLTDGTAAGTQEAADLTTIRFARVADFLVAVGQRSFGPVGLWRIDPGLAPPTELVSFGPAFVALAPAQTRAYAFAFTFPGHGLWTTDGTAAGTRKLASFAGAARSFTAVGDQLAIAVGTSNDIELWFSDGTVGGTRLVKDIRVGPVSSEPRFLTASGSRVFFSADDGVHGRELWVSDGTPGGTRLVRDIFPGSTGSGPASLAATDAGVVFAADDGVRGVELWASDGTAGGTRLVADIDARAGASSRPRSIVRIGSDWLFVATTPAIGEELWATDLRSVRLVGDLRPGPVSAEIELPVADNAGSNPSRLFRANDGVHGSELWYTDGTPARTRMVKDIEPGFQGSQPTGLVRDGTQVLFAARTYHEGTELWRLDLRDLEVPIAVPFGLGCAGTNGVPVHRARSLPTLGNTAFGYRVTSARAGSATGLLFSAQRAFVPLGGGCRLLVELGNAPVLTTTNARGEATVPVPIPASPSLLGVAIATQCIVLDPRGANANTLAFSNGLQTLVGR